MCCYRTQWTNSCGTPIWPWCLALTRGGSSSLERSQSVQVSGSLVFFFHNNHFVKPRNSQFWNSKLTKVKWEVTALQAVMRIQNYKLFLEIKLLWRWALFDWTLLCLQETEMRTRDRSSECPAASTISCTYCAFSGRFYLPVSHPQSTGTAGRAS